MSSAPLHVRLIGGVSLGATGLLGLGCNLLLLFIFVTNFNSIRRTAFIVVAWQMIIGDLMVILTQLTIAVPVTFAGHTIFRQEIIEASLSTLDTLGFLCNMYFAFTLILNRFTIFCTPRINEILFGRVSVYVSVGCVWTILISRVIFVFGSKCWKTFSPEGFFFTTTCQNNTNSFALYLHMSTKYESYVIPAAMFVLYVIVLLRIHVGVKFKLAIKQMSIRKRNIERKLLIQSILMCGALQLETIAFSFFKKLGLEGNAYFYVNFFQNACIILNSSVHPIVLFIFNSDVRSGLFGLVKSSASVQPFSGMHTSSQRPYTFSRYRRESNFS
ncbi:hypothetical protein QR680_006336 [Steinernema hermaphroditum]|uniref:G-protein coupled receptors family 1 profile domain-containing protein n=1 Tax=Steinernema hermaphroditum TaxID=289476 RepID=A0AA39LWY9_9BILA|nr:hypothetical protein QR680_006336 [Steinernema hermaphroditum]